MLSHGRHGIKPHLPVVTNHSDNLEWLAMPYYSVSLPRLDLDSPTVICGETFNTWVVAQIEGL